MREIDKWTGKIHCGHAIETLRKMPSESVDCLVTSPPYFGLRDYGESTKTIWGGDKDCKHVWKNKNYLHPTRKNRGEGIDPKHKTAGVKQPTNLKADICQRCGAWYGQLGLEPTIEMYIDHLGEIFIEVKRVLKKTGTCWINIGDTYGGSWGNYGERKGKQRKQTAKKFKRRGVLSKDFLLPMTKLQPKSLCMIPERFAFMMIDLGFILRNKNIWHKGNPMPSSVKDRFNCTWEYVYFFSKSKKYYFDLDAVRVPHKTQTLERWQRAVNQDNISKKGKYVDAPEQGHLSWRRGGRLTTPTWFKEQFGKDKHYQGKFDELVDPIRIVDNTKDNKCDLCGQMDVYYEAKDWLDVIPPEHQKKVLCRKCYRGFKIKGGKYHTGDGYRQGMNRDEDVLVEKRPYLPQPEELIAYLKKYKGKITYKEIDKALGKTGDTASHWFTDPDSPHGFSYPSKEDWFALKKMLKFDDTYDKQMTEVIYTTSEVNPQDKVFRKKTEDESLFKKGGMRQAPEPGEAGAFHPKGKNPGDIIQVPYSVQPRTKEIIEYRNLPDIYEFSKWLNEQRKTKKLTINRIEEIFGTQAPHHWFNAESYPTVEDYRKLKEILGLDDAYDEALLTVYKKPAEKQNDPIGKNPGDVIKWDNVPGQNPQTIRKHSGYYGPDGKCLVDFAKGKNPGDIWAISPSTTGDPDIPSASGMKEKILNASLTDEEKERALSELFNVLVAYAEGRIQNFRVRVRGEKPCFGNSAELSGRARELEKKGFYITTVPNIGRNPGDVLYRGKENEARSILVNPSGKESSIYHYREGKYIAGYYHKDGKNPGDYWTINTKPFPDAHFAVFPEELVIKPIKCSCPRYVCKKCGKPRQKINKRIGAVNKQWGERKSKPWHKDQRDMPQKVIKEGIYETVGLTECQCGKKHGYEPGIVLDPFAGAGTTCLVAQKLGRRWMGVEINPKYAEMSEDRIKTRTAQKEFDLGGINR